MNQLTPSGPPCLEAVNPDKRYEDGVLGAGPRLVCRHARTGLCHSRRERRRQDDDHHLFLNLLEPTEGEARVCGVNSHREPLLAKEKVAFVSGKLDVVSHFTALQNLDFLPGLVARPVKPLMTTIALDRVGLDRAWHPQAS